MENLSDQIEWHTCNSPLQLYFSPLSPDHYSVRHDSMPGSDALGSSYLETGSELSAELWLICL